MPLPMRISTLLFLLLGAGPLMAEEGGAAGTLLLIANPERHHQGYFRKSVVLVKRHGQSGSVGVILNRPSEHALETLFPENHVFKGSGKQLFRGGPLSPKTLLYLYRDALPRSDALAVGEDYFLTFKAASIEALLNEKKTLSQVRVFNGHAGWGRGQLQQEISRGDWFVIPLQVDYLLGDHPEALWETLIRRFRGGWVGGPTVDPAGLG